MDLKVCIIGLGYVGLPLAISFAKHFPGVIGFDTNEYKVQELSRGYDRTGEVSKEELENTSLYITSNYEDLRGAHFFIIAVPTPIDHANKPDLKYLIMASETVGRVMQPGAIIVYESTVYPGVTEEVCGPVLEKISGLRQGLDFKLGYSPERINPGDKEHCFENIIKVISGEDRETLETISSVYNKVVKAGVYKATSIKVAEAAKVIENTQRDLNIALMNELAIIFNKLGIRTTDVLNAARTKWNFVPFKPGLVGGHCIGVDPYYLTYKAEEVGFHPQVILAGRRINDGMGKFIAEQTMKHLLRSANNIAGLKVGILGLTFKENVPDLRNSRVPDIISELGEYGISVLVHDPICEEAEALLEYNIKLTKIESMIDLDALIIAVAHDYYKDIGIKEIIRKLKNNATIIDVKSIFQPEEFPKGIKYWSL